MAVIATASAVSTNIKGKEAIFAVRAVYETERKCVLKIRAYTG